MNYDYVWCLNKKDLMKETNISKPSMDKMKHGKQGLMDTIDRLCSYFDCKFENVIQHYQDREDV